MGNNHCSSRNCIDLVHQNDDEHHHQKEDDMDDDVVPQNPKKGETNKNSEGKDNNHQKKILQNQWTQSFFVHKKLLTNKIDELNKTKTKSTTPSSENITNTESINNNLKKHQNINDISNCSAPRCASNIFCHAKSLASATSRFLSKVRTTTNNHLDDEIQTTQTDPTFSRSTFTSNDTSPDLPMIDNEIDQDVNKERESDHYEYTSINDTVYNGQNQKNSNIPRLNKNIEESFYESTIEMDLIDDQIKEKKKANNDKNKKKNNIIKKRCQLKDNNKTKTKLNKQQFILLNDANNNDICNLYSEINNKQQQNELETSFLPKKKVILFNFTFQS
jgi:hypothetical protein